MKATQLTLAKPSALNTAVGYVHDTECAGAANDLAGVEKGEWFRSCGCNGNYGKNAPKEIHLKKSSIVTSVSS